MATLQCGHAAGDELLRRLAAILRDGVREWIAAADAALYRAKASGRNRVATP